jgi:Fe(3+) dicitrate transport protein
MIIKRQIILAISLIISGFTYGAGWEEKESIFDSLKPTTLGPVEIIEYKMRMGNRNADEVDGNIIFAAKKNEIVMLEGAAVNTVNNEARQVFAQVPGISIWENDGSGIQVGVASRGLSPNRSWEFNVRQNGYDISADPLGYPEAYYNPPFEAVERIQVVRGSSSLQFGPQFGGLLNYILLDAPKDKKIQFQTRQSVGSFGMFNSFNSLGGTIKKISYYGYYNFKRADGFRPNSKYFIHNGFAKLGYKINERWSLSAENTVMDFVSQQPGGLTDLQLSENIKQSSRARNWLGIRWIMPSVSLNFNLNERHKIDVKVFGVIGDRGSNAFVRAINVPDTINASTGAYNNRQIDKDLYRNVGAEIRYLYNYNISDNKQSLAVGARYYYGNTKRYFSGRGDSGNQFNLNLQDTLFGRELNYINQNAAVYAENVFRAGHFVIVPGIRLEVLQSQASGFIGRSSTIGEKQFMPDQNRWRVFPLAGLGLEYHFKSSTEIYANASQAYRPVLFSDLTPTATTDSIGQNLSDAQGMNFDLGYRGKIKNWLEFDVSGFYLIYNNRIGTITQLNDEGKSYQLRTNLGNAHSRGGEAFISFDLLSATKVSNQYGNLKLWASVSYINAVYTKLATSKVENGVLVTTDFKNKKVENAPSFINRFGATYSYKFFTLNYIASWTDGAFADASNTILPNAAATSGYIPSHYVMDLNLTFSFLKDRFNVKSGVSNITSNKYFTRRAGGLPGPGVLPGEPRNFFLSVGIKI